MDILPVNNMTRIVENTRHDDRDQSRQRRQPPRKQEKIDPVAVYSPDGHVEEEGRVSKIDVVA
jgi:hypothetical protein